MFCYVQLPIMKIGPEFASTPVMEYEQPLNVTVTLDPSLLEMDISPVLGYMPQPP
jgi:hypothetical protein